MGSIINNETIPGGFVNDTSKNLSIDIAIGGGGIAGLITAIALRRAGHKVTVRIFWISGSTFHHRYADPE